MDWQFGAVTGIQFTAEWQTTLVTFGSCRGFLENPPRDHSRMGMPGKKKKKKKKWGMKDARHRVWFCFRHSSSRSLRIITRVRGRFYGLWLENKMLRVSCRRSDDLQLWMIKWAPGWQCGCVRAAEDPDMSDMWMRVWSYSECGHRSVVIYIGTRRRREKFWLTSRYQYLTSSSHIISTVSTSFSSDHGLFHVVRNWNRNQNQ